MYYHRPSVRYTSLRSTYFNYCRMLCTLCIYLCVWITLSVSKKRISPHTPVIVEIELLLAVAAGAEAMDALCSLWCRCCLCWLSWFCWGDGGWADGLLLSPSFAGCISFSCLLASFSVVSMAVAFGVVGVFVGVSSFARFDVSDSASS